MFVIRPDGGEAVQLTNAENGVGGYAWSPDGKQIAFTMSDMKEKDVKARRDYLGDFEVVRGEYNHQHLRTLDVAEALNAPVAGTERTKGKDYSVGSFAWAPDGKRIAFSATKNPDLIQGGTSDIYMLDLAKDAVKKVVEQPGPDNNPRWSPDGRMLVFSSAMGNPKYFHANSRLAVVPVEGGTPRSITDSFDESPNLIDWNAGGVYFGASQKTATHLFRVDPAGGKVARVSQDDRLMLAGASFTKDARSVAFAASTPTTLGEIYVTAVEPFAPKKLTSMTDQVSGWTLGKREVISWRSKDGTPIEGVLIKPADFDPAKKYALLCVIHGGPTGVDRPTMIDTRYYPADIWASRGALVLKVNYRGSAGYGEKFRQLNVRNLGVGDAWDVLSGVEHLVKQGSVDPKRVGCMGWSQGGYISAFLTTSSDRVRGDLGGRRHLQLGHLLLQHRHHAVHDPVPRRRPGGRPGDLREDVADDLRQAGEDADADPARRVRPPRADPERLRAAPGPRGPGREGGDGGLQGLRPRHHEAQVLAGRDAAQPGVVQPLHLRRPAAGLREAGDSEGRGKEEVARLQWIVTGTVDSGQRPVDSRSRGPGLSVTV